MTSNQHTNPTSAPRRDTSGGLYAPPANHWLRMIYAGLTKIRCLLTCTDGVETNSEEITEGDTVAVLGANIRSKAVTVANTGARALEIREDGATVAIVAPGKVRLIGTPGLLALTARVWAGDENIGDASVTVTRHLRCDCGDEEVVYTIEPVGSFLL